MNDEKKRAALTVWINEHLYKETADRVMTYLNALGYDVRLCKERYDIDDYRLELTKGGYSIKGKFPCAEKSSIDKFIKQIKAMVEALELLIYRSSEENHGCLEAEQNEQNDCT